MGGWKVFLGRLVQKIWFRAALFSLAAVALALVAGALGPLLPDALAVELGQNSVGSILQIIASSMLAVTTFSLTAMVSAYSSATTTATPRATQLLLADPTSQNALSTFIGSFLFSIVGIIALSTGYYTEQARTVLFFGTLIVIAIIALTLLRWISHLSRFGRMADLIDRVERAATRTIRTFGTRPHLGGRPAVAIPTHAHPVFADTSGYVTAIDVTALQNLADSDDLIVHVTAIPGTMTDATRALARIEGLIDGDGVRALRRAFTIDPHRTYEQDPRLGVIALAEIASRALSPSTNDPGTAIEVLGALQRVFAAFGEASGGEGDGKSPRERVYVPAPEIRDLIEDGFRPIARDGAGTIEVQLRLQKTLAACAASCPAHADEFARAAKAARARADRGLPDRADRALLRRAAREAWNPA